MDQSERAFDIDELASLASLPRRTIRYYIQEGLVDHPIGSRKAATYGSRHLEQLLTIRRWKDSGLSLDRIRQLLDERDNPPPGAERARGPGTLEVVSRLIVSDGLEVLLEPRMSGLTPEQVRKFMAGVMSLYEQIMEKGTD